MEKTAVVAEKKKTVALQDQLKERDRKFLSIWDMVFPSLCVFLGLVSGEEFCSVLSCSIT